MWHHFISVARKWNLAAFTIYKIQLVFKCNHFTSHMCIHIPSQYKNKGLERELCLPVGYVRVLGLQDL